VPLLAMEHQELVQGVALDASSSTNKARSIKRYLTPAHHHASYK